MGDFTFRRRGTVAVLAGAAALAVTVSVVPAWAAPSSSNGRHVIPDSAPQWLSQATGGGATPNGDPIRFGLLLGMRDPSGAAATIQRISAPDSAQYGAWLSTEQFHKQFAPADSDVAAVRDWLTSAGFRVDKTLPSGMLVEASGTAAQVDKVFDTTLADFSYRGKKLHTNVNALSFPAGTPSAVVSAVAGVLDMDQGAQLHQPAATLPGPPDGFRSAQPCSDYYGQKIATDQPAFNGVRQPYAVCGYGPEQLQQAYGETSLLRGGVDGRGVKVAVVDPYASPTMLADAQKYNQAHHEPLFRTGQYREITPPAGGYNSIDECDPQFWYGEEALGVEAVHAMAPGADVVYVGATDCNGGLDNAFAETVDNHTADIISNSWGANTDDINVLGADVVKFYDQFTMEAALTGITVNFSTGDDGDFTAGGTNPAAKTVSFPADEPYVTGVGGTSIGIGSNGRRQFEYGFQSAYAQLDGKGGWGPFKYFEGGGGGTSVIYKQPFYQQGKVPATDSGAGGAAMRTVPDIAAVGDQATGFMVGLTQVFPEGTHWDQYREGGTSVSAPLMAGMVAVADQAGHRKLGFANPLYYKLLSTPALNDITAPKTPVTAVRVDYLNGIDSSGGVQNALEDVDTQTTTLHSRPGYDTETGTGTPKGPQFFTALAK